MNPEELVDLERIEYDACTDWYRAAPAAIVEAYGIDEFEANVRNVQAALPGAEYSRTSGVDSHHGLHRYSWQISRDGEVLLPGFDVASIDEEGRVTRVLGFFGPLPEED